MDSDRQLEQWAEQLRRAGPELEAVRREEMRTADNRAGLAFLAPAFEHALRASPMRTSSGMVEMQALFAKLRR